MNYKETQKMLHRYLVARIPFLSFITAEKQRALDMLTELSKALNHNILVHSMSTGIYNLVNGEIINNEKNVMAALDYIAETLKTKENQTFVLSDISDIETDTFTARYLADIINTADKRSSSIIVITSDGVWTNLQRLGISFKLDLPTEEELLVIIKETLAPYQIQLKSEWDENDFKEVANILLGISKNEARNVISTLVAKGSLEKKDLVDLKFTKDNLFSDISGLEKIALEENLTFGGLENLKDWLDEKHKLLRAERKEELKRRGIIAPRGILLMGVPGCGKSLSAKAIATRWQMPLYLLDFSTIQGKYVGQSEQQLKEALDTAGYVSPCVLWIDEIEKGLAGTSDSTGVTNRLIGQFLFWLQENRKEVFIVATANNIHDLPPELLRKGRFDEIFFVDLPSEKERFEIISLYIQKYLNVKVSEAILNNLVSLSEKFSGADIESTIRNVAYHVIADNVTLSVEMLADAFKNTMPTYKASAEKVEKIREWAKDKTIRASKDERTAEKKEAKSEVKINDDIEVL